MKNLIIKILEAIAIFFHPRGGTYILRKSASIASFYINDALSQKVSDIKTIIDVGANIGQYALASNLFYPEATIHSFEPLPNCFEQLKNNVEGKKNIFVYNLAMGSNSGVIKFYQNNHSHASSALSVSNYQKSNMPMTQTTKEIQVQVSTLDSFLVELPIVSPVLLKIDVQGYELEVLKGGQSTIKNIDYVLLETSFTPMYENEPLFDELHSYLKASGFELIAPLDFLRSKSKIFQMDVLYKKVNL